MKIVFILLLFLAGSAVFFLGRFSERRKWRRQLRALNFTADTIMRGNYTPDFSPFAEGELSILAGHLELLVKRVQSMLDTLQKDKAAIQDFTADISHQIKTPLTGLLGYLDLLEHGAPDAQTKETLRKCLFLAERMNELIRALLELARLDQGAVALRAETCVLPRVMRDAITAVQSGRPAVRRDVRVRIPGGLELRCDAKWLSQALINLLLNAFDYSVGNEPVVIEGEAAGNLVLIRIKNACGPLPESDLRNLFVRFYRANKKSGGFGIGLSLAESIIRLHKGNIRASYEDGFLTMHLALPALSCSSAV